MYVTLLPVVSANGKDDESVTPDDGKDGEPDSTDDDDDDEPAAPENDEDSVLCVHTNYIRSLSCLPLFTYTVWNNDDAGTTTTLEQ